MRERDHLRQRYAAILSPVGAILALSGVVMLLPLLVLPACPQEAGHAWAFVAPAGGLVVIGPTGVGISTAEGRGDQLAPHVRQSARLVLIIYSAYAALGTLAYWMAGMSPFDAVNHAFAAVSTGGFSTRLESIGTWDSAAVEAVTLPLMILGNMSFVTAWLLWRGEVRFVARNGEVRLMSVLIPVSAALIFILTSQGIYSQLDKSLRVAIFEAVSALTTTGFSTVSYGNWNAPGLIVLIVLMLIGGGTCSTAGGIKQFRAYLMWKLLFWEISRFLLPRSAVVERPIWEGPRRVFVDDARVRQVATFVFLYLTTYVLGTLILCACGYSLADSLFEFASALGTVGLSVGVTASGMPDVALWAETVAMFIGRLEFFVVIVSLLKIIGDCGRLMAPASHGLRVDANGSLQRKKMGRTWRSGSVLRQFRGIGAQFGRFRRGIKPG